MNYRTAQVNYQGLNRDLLKDKEKKGLLEILQNQNQEELKSISQSVFKIRDVSWLDGRGTENGHNLFLALVFDKPSTYSGETLDKIQHGLFHISLAKLCNTNQKSPDYQIITKQVDLVDWTKHVKDKIKSVTFDHGYVAQTNNMKLFEFQVKKNR